MVPVRELPYWPAAMALLIEAGQMTASDYVPIYPDLPLASEGASTEVVCSNGADKLGLVENGRIGRLGTSPRLGRCLGGTALLSVRQRVRVDMLGLA